MAAPVTYALPGARRKPVFNATFFLSSDAAKGDALTPVIAGYLHGVYWQYLYPNTWDDLPIAVLEFLALAVSIIVFAPLLHDAPHVVLQTDSLTTTFVLAHDPARSPLLVAAHTLLLDTAQYAQLVAGYPSCRLVQISHVHGDANLAADHLSRNNMFMFNNLCVNLGVRPHHLALSQAAYDYLHALFDRIKPILPIEMYCRGRTPAAPDYDGPFSRPQFHSSSR